MTAKVKITTKLKNEIINLGVEAVLFIILFALTNAVCVLMPPIKIHSIMFDL